MALNRFAGFRDGSHEAFRFYFNEFQESIFNFALRRTGDKDRAQEITQEAFMKLWMFRERIKDEAHLERFLFVVARNLFLQYEKKDAINYQRDLELSYLFRYGVYSSEDPEAALNEVFNNFRRL